MNDTNWDYEADTEDRPERGRSRATPSSTDSTAGAARSAFVSPSVSTGTDSPSPSPNHDQPSGRTVLNPADSGASAGSNGAFSRAASFSRPSDPKLVARDKERPTNPFDTASTPAGPAAFAPPTYGGRPSPTQNVPGATGAGPRAYNPTQSNPIVGVDRTGLLPPPLPTPPVTPLGSAPSRPAYSSTPTTGADPFSAPGAPPTLTQSEALRTSEASFKAAKPPRGWGWRTLVAFLAGALISGAAFTAGTVVAEQDPQVSAPVTTPVNNTVPPEAQPGPEFAPVEGENPAAFVAANLGPSVVQIRTDLGTGSGVVYKEGGLVMTNNHVIEGFTEVAIVDSQGRTLNGTVIGSDPRADIAVIEVPGLGLPVADLALDKELVVGQTAIAIGSPFDLTRSVTSGIISALNRPLQNQNNSFTSMIQTDAPINPGNSGGPLANRFGEVIGINTAIRTDGVSQANVGVGFAVPIDTAYAVAERIVNGESLEPGFLGVGQGEPAIGEVGVVIDNINPGSAAEDAGLRAGDRVLTVNGAGVTDFLELAGLISNNFPGDEITLEIVRGETPQTIVATLGER